MSLPMPATKCLTPTCRNSRVHSRGLCQTCYRTAANLVKAKRTTWKKLEDGKKCLPKKYAGRKRDWFLGNAK